MIAKVKNINSKKNVVDGFRNEAFDIGFYQYFGNIKQNKISQVLNNRERKINLASITYRQLNSWENEELLTIERENKEWRKFSIMDALWVKIIQELRNFGFPIEKIKVAKESLSFLSNKCKVAQPFLEFYTAFAIGSKMPVMLLVFSDGVAIPVNFTQYKVTKEILDIENHIQINLNEMLQSLFPNVDLKPKYEMQTAVSIEEMEVLAFMRVKRFEKVAVHYTGGKVDTIEGLERVNSQKRISEILKEQQFAKIELIEQDGKVVSVVRTIKKKVKK